MEVGRENQKKRKKKNGISDIGEGSDCIGSILNGNDVTDEGRLWIIVAWKDIWSMDKETRMYMYG